MIGIIGRLKREMFEDGKHRKYLLYGFGEILLVIIGILIALQIDNWNSERQDRIALQEYLGSVARNMSQDLIELQRLSARRDEALFNVLMAYNLSLEWREEGPDADFVLFSSTAVQKASELRYFNANTSGYQALRISGLLVNLQGRDVEDLLFDYYDTIDRVARMENDHNALVRDLRLQLNSEFPDGLEWWQFINPESLAPEYFAERQPLFAALLDSRAFAGLMSSASDLAGLLREYDRAITMGRVFIRLVQDSRWDFDEPARAVLQRLDNPARGIGRPVVIDQGRILFHGFYLNLPDSTAVGLFGAETSAPAGGWDYRSLSREGDSLRLEYPGNASWGALSLAVRGNYGAAGRAHMDYSMYRSLRLELRGERNGDTVLVSMKDSEDPDDGSQTNVELELSSDWQTYEIPLERFENADLSRLHVALGLLFFDQPQTLYIRSARFVP